MLIFDPRSSNLEWWRSKWPSIKFEHIINNSFLAFGFESRGKFSFFLFKNFVFCELHILIDRWHRHAMNVHFYDQRAGYHTYITSHSLILSLSLIRPIISLFVSFQSKLEISTCNPFYVVRKRQKKSNISHEYARINGHQRCKINVNSIRNFVFVCSALFFSFCRYCDFDTIISWDNSVERFGHKRWTWCKYYYIMVFIFSQQ